MGGRWSGKYKDSMNWVCIFSLIPVIRVHRNSFGGFVAS